LDITYIPPKATNGIANSILDTIIYYYYFKDRGTYGYYASPYDPLPYLTTTITFPLCSFYIKSPNILNRVIKAKLQYCISNGDIWMLKPLSILYNHHWDFGQNGIG
jgi:hypothetical protein